MSVPVSTISLQKAASNEPDKQVKEIKIVLNTKHEDTNTIVRIGEDESDSTNNPPVKVRISNMKTTKFHGMTDWVGEHKDNPKIWLNYEGNFLNIICAHRTHETYQRDKEYMINVNDIAYVSVTY